MRQPTKILGENNGADNQLCSNVDGPTLFADVGIIST